MATQEALVRSARRFVTAAVLALAVLVASRGLLTGVFGKRLMGGHDTSAYALFLTEFHDNIRHGNWFPVWAPHLQWGYGEPHLQFRPPLQAYTAELFYLVTGHPFVALNLTCVLFLLLSGVGMLLLCRRILALLAARLPHLPRAEWAPLFGAAAYVVSPYPLRDIYVRGAFSETACFAVFPWLALAFIELARKPDSPRLAAAAVACAALGMSHAPVLIFTMPFLLLAALIYRREVRSPAAIAAAIALGFLASSFFWAAALGESGLIKTALMAAGFEAYVGHFVALHQLVYMPWSFSDGAIRLSLGIVTWIGLAWALWRWAERPHGERGDEYFRLSAMLLLFCVISIYFMHRASSLWYEAFPWLQIMTFPWRFLALVAFFGTLLGTLAAARLLRNELHWAGLALVVLAFGASEAAPPYFSSEPAESFTGERIAAGGMGWSKPYSSPSTAGELPKARAAEAVEFVSGRGEQKCERKSPTRMECDVMAVQASTIRFNTLDFPGWRTLVDGKPAVTARREPLRGTQLVSLVPGKHAVVWEFGLTTIRAVTRAVSILAWIVLAGLLFQDQLLKAKALFPKRGHHLE